MKTAFIVCSRIGSNRIPGKAMRKVNGLPLIEHLIKRLLKIGLPVIIAIPEDDYREYAYLDRAYEKLYIYVGDANDPLSRMKNVADKYKLDQVIRVTHDKIFIEGYLVYAALNQFNKGAFDYLYGDFSAGTAFEIISSQALRAASTKYEDIEHISYSIKSITDNVTKYAVPEEYKSDLRLLIDYPEDLRLLELIMCKLGNECNLMKAIKYARDVSWIKFINIQPDLTLYTCAYNAEKTIDDAMSSFICQPNKKYMEYILIDDCSTDGTYEKMLRFSLNNNNVRVYRNQINIGLASSSNIALKKAKGRYIVRLDADDHIIQEGCIKLLHEIIPRGLDAIYPNYFDGSYGKIGFGKTHHHPAGAIFSTKALNHVKYTEGLRNLDGLDLYVRAKEQIKIGYLNTPTFFYRHTKNSMSRTNLNQREETRKEILSNA